MGELLLKIENLTVSFDTEEGRVTAVDRVSLDIPRGCTIGLVGESGCGKSITALSILRLIPCPPGRIQNGRILFDECNLLELSPQEMRRIRGNRISMIFQEPMTSLSPLHSIGSQMLEAIQLHRDMPHNNAKQLVLDALRDVGIPDPDERFHALPHQLSGGMRQRVMIAMAMLLNPALLIADEPTTALDVTLQAQILELMRQRLSSDQSLLLITHNMGVVWQMCERLAVMYAGQVVETGKTEEIFKSPLHPYTEALLRSIPPLDKTVERLPAIPGQVPSPFNWPQGCRFQSRCPYVMEQCRQEMPALEQYQSGETLDGLESNQRLGTASPSIETANNTPGGRGCAEPHSIDSANNTPGGRGCTEPHSIDSANNTPGGRGCAEPHSNNKIPTEPFRAARCFLAQQRMKQS